MTDCPNGDMRDLLPELLHGRLSPAARAEVEAHVRDCADCRAELELLRAMRSSLRRGPAVDVASIVAAVPPYRAPLRRSWGGWRAAAAIVLLVAGGASVAVLRDGGSNVRDSVAVTSGAGVRTPVQGGPRDSVAPASTPTAAPRELALASSAIGDLDDAELSALLKDLSTVEVLPAADVEITPSISPVSPTGTE